MDKVFGALLAVLVGSLALGAAPGHAETVVFTARLLAANEVPGPITNADRDAVGLAVLTLDITRGVGNAISSATARFDVGLARFPTTDSVTGLHLHQGVAGVNGLIRIDSGIGVGGQPPLSLAGGDTVVTRENRQVDPVDAGDILADPSAWYVNVHTTLNTSGAIRGQLEGPSAAFPGVLVGVFPSAVSFGPGDSLELKLFVANVGAPAPADVFAGLALPPTVGAGLCPGAGDTALLFVGAAGTSIVCASALGPGSPVVFLAEDLTLPTFPLTIVTLVGGQLPPDAPAGDFVGFAGVAAPNTFPGGPIKVTTSPFTIQN